MSGSIWNQRVGTNLIAAVLVLVGLQLEEGMARMLWLNTGLFALSGALTNWLAITMLFERIPGLYGTGVIPLHFEDFKRGIHALVMEQFFTPENLERFLQDSGGDLPWDSLMEHMDLDDAFESLVGVIEASSFGPMLAMVGGRQALTPLKEPFLEKMKEHLVQVTSKPELKQALGAHASNESMLERVNQIVQARLDELTPEKVKEIVEAMIREHLGWLVVWGGVFGGLIGFVSTFLF